MNSFSWVLKKFIAVFQQLALRALTVGVNAFQKLRYFGWSFLIKAIGAVTFLWKVLRSRAFIINLVIALVIELFLIAAPYHNHENFPNWAKPVASYIHSWTCKKEDAYIDWVMKMYMGTELKEEQEQQKAHAFVWLDIDEKTYKEWNKPPYTPREKLRDLIQFSVNEKHRAKLVIVDINLTHTTGPGGKKLSNEDNDLMEYFKNYSKEPVHPPIILAGTFDVKNHKTNAGGDQPKSCVEKSHSFLDDYDVVTDNIYWAAPTFYKEAGGIIRRLQLWEGPGKEGQVFPSIPLLTGALIRKPKGLIKKNCDLHHFTPDCLCSKCAGDWQDDDIRWRIIYRMPWKPEKDETPVIQFNGETHLLKVISDSELLKVISAGELLKVISDSELLKVISAGELLKVISDSERLKVISASELLKVISPIELLKVIPVSRIQDKKEDYAKDIKDRIVMIGGSYDDPQDFHETPLGRMPGALIILNAIHSLFLGKIQPLCGWQKFSILTLFVFIMSFCFTVFRPFKAMVISFVVVVSFLVILMFLMGDSLFLFRPGVLFDFAIPLAIIGILNSLPLKEFVSGLRKD